MNRAHLATGATFSFDGSYDTESFDTLADARQAIEGWENINSPYILQDGENDRPELTVVRETSLPNYLRQTI